MENEENEETTEEEENEEEKEEENKEEGETEKQLKSAIAQKEHFREKFEKAELENKELKEKIKPPEQKQQEQNPLEVVKLAKALEGYSDEETEFIISNAKGQNIENIITASKNEWVQLAITAKREKVAKEKQIPGSSGVGSLGAKVERKSAKEIWNMTDKEYKTYIEKLEKEEPKEKIAEI